MSAQLLENAGIPGWADTELKNLVFSWMALSKTESDSVREVGVWVSGEMSLKAGEMGWIGVREGGRRGRHKDKPESRREGTGEDFFHLPRNTKPSFYPVAFQIL